MIYRSALGTVYSSVRSVLKAGIQGIPVGETAGYPRIEIHSLTEDSEGDKGDAVRRIAFTVESMSATGYRDAVAMNQAVCGILAGTRPTLDDAHFRPLQVIAAQLTEMPETVDTQTQLFRQLQRFYFLVQQID